VIIKYNNGPMIVVWYWNRKDRDSYIIGQWYWWW